MFSTKMPLLAAISAAMILTVCATSKTWIKKEVYTSSGCSTSADIIEDKRQDSYYVGECMQNQVATAARRRNTITDEYMKPTCTANTANTGFTIKKYTDNACTAGETQESAGTTDGSCPGGTGTGPDWTKYTCATTSSTVGAVEYGIYSAADCPDNQLNGAGFLLINYCEKEADGNAWDKSEKWLIDNGKIKKYEYTNTADKDCGGTGSNTREFVLGCQTYGDEWIKIGALVDGADIAGASTFGASASSAGGQAPLKIMTVVLALVLAVGLVFHQ